MILAVASCLSLAVSASATGAMNRKATDFKDFDRTAWYADAVSAAVDNGLLYGKSSTIIDPNGDMTRAEMAAIINRSFGCYAKADISKYKDVSKDSKHDFLFLRNRKYQVGSSQTDSGYTRRLDSYRPLYAGATSMYPAVSYGTFVAEPASSSRKR